MRILILYVALEALSTQLVAQDMARRPFEARGLAAFTSGDYRTCAIVFSRAGTEHLREPSPEFMAARCYARLGDSQRAARHLVRALDRGFRNCAALRSETALADLVTLQARCERNVDAFLQSSNLELVAAYFGDRADRSAAIEDAEALRRRDAMRRNVVLIAVSRRLVRTADDYLHVALVMQHGVRQKTSRSRATWRARRSSFGRGSRKLAICKPLRRTCIYMRWASLRSSARNIDM